MKERLNTNEYNCYHWIYSFLMCQKSDWGITRSFHLTSKQQVRKQAPKSWADGSESHRLGSGRTGIFTLFQGQQGLRPPNLTIQSELLCTKVSLGFDGPCRLFPDTFYDCLLVEYFPETWNRPEIGLGAALRFAGRFLLVTVQINQMNYVAQLITCFDPIAL